MRENYLLPTENSTREKNSRDKFSIFRHFKSIRREIIKRYRPCTGKLSQNKPLIRRKVLQSIIFHDWHLGRFPVHFYSEQPTRVDEKVTSRKSTSSIDDALPHVRSGHDLTPERSKFCFHAYAIFVNHVQASSLTFLRFVKSDFGNQSIWLASWGISC